MAKVKNRIANKHRQKNAAQEAAFRDLNVSERCTYEDKKE